MKLNIKNARRLETQISEEMHYVSNHMVPHGSDYTTAEESIKNTKARIASKIELYDEYLRIKFAIRSLIGKFNADKGINDYTVAIAIAENKINCWEGLLCLDVPRSMYNRVLPITYAPGVDEGYSDTTRAHIKRLQREVQRLKDKCQGVNSQGSIELSTADYTFLQKNGLLD